MAAFLWGGLSFCIRACSLPFAFLVALKPDKLTDRLWESVDSVSADSDSDSVFRSHLKAGFGVWLWGAV